MGQAFSILREQPLRLLSVGLVFQLLAGLTQAGFIGILVVLALPALTAGVLQAVHESSVGGRPSLLSLFAAFRRPERLPALLVLGAITFGLGVLAVAVLLAGSLSGLDPALVARLEAGDAAAVAELDPGLLQRSLLGLLVGMLLGAALSYFAIPLIWFAGLPVGAAILVGLREMIRQWRALLALGLVLGLVGFPVAMGVGVILSAQMLGQGPSPLSSLLLLFMVVLYQLLLLSSQYVSFADCFSSAPDEPGEEDKPDQLVA